MSKIEEYTIRGKITRVTAYESIDEIIAVIQAHEQFHDGFIEYIGHDPNGTTIVFKHYADPEYKIYRLVFTGNAELFLDLDLQVRYIYEVSIKADDRTEVFFDGTGIIVKADNVKLEVQELLN